MLCMSQGGACGTSIALFNIYFLVGTFYLDLFLEFSKLLSGSISLKVMLFKIILFQLSVSNIYILNQDLWLERATRVFGLIIESSSIVYSFIIV